MTHMEIWRKIDISSKPEAKKMISGVTMRSPGMLKIKHHISQYFMKNEQPIFTFLFSFVYRPLKDCRESACQILDLHTLPLEAVDYLRINKGGNGYVTNR